MLCIGFDIKERPIVNGLNAVAFNVGTAVILWFMPMINSATGSWYNSLTLFSLASLFIALAWLFVRFSDEPSVNKSADVPAEDYTYIKGLKDKFNWAYGLTYSGLLAFYICLFTFYPKADISQSKWVIGFGIIGTLAGIVFSKKVARRLPVIRWSG